MAWSQSIANPIADPAAVDVAPFAAAEEAGLSMPDCYLAAVEAWRRAHPDQAIEYASKQTVEVVLKAPKSLGPSLSVENLQARYL